MRLPVCLAWALCLTLLAVGAVRAEKSMYVSDRMQVIVRANPANEAKILEHISTGEVVTVLESNTDGWIRLRTAGGKEGWAISRYFVEEPPAVVRLRDLGPQGKDLSARLEETRKENEGLKRALQQAEAKASQAEAGYAKLRVDSADVFKLREEFSKLKEDYEEQGQRLEEMASENESLRFGTNLKWFMAGGGVLLLGWILGMASGRRKRRWQSTLD